MKRTLLTAILAVAAVVAFAKADDEQMQITKADGIASIFEKGKTANVKFVYADDCTASYQGISAMPYKEYVRVNGEWEEEHTYGEEGFTEEWNDRNKKGMKIVDGEADFTIIVTIHGIKEMTAYNSWWEITKGDVMINDKEGQTVVAYNLSEYYEVAGGFGQLRLRSRIRATFEGLAESMIAFAKKANKK